MMRRLAMALRYVADRIDSASVVTYKVDPAFDPALVAEIRRGINRQLRSEGRQAL